MAEAPMCKICDPPRRHWKGEPHKFRDLPKAASEKAEAGGASPPVASPDLGSPVRPIAQAVERRQPTTSVKVPAGKKVVLRDVAETRAYMRQYMRDRTVAKKLGLTVKEYRARRKEREG